MTINRFYVVQEGSRPAEGFDPKWWPHLWRVKCGPITDSQEYRDILGTGEEEGDLRNLLSKYQDEIVINDKILEQAEKDVPSDPILSKSAHLYVDPSVPDKLIQPQALSSLSLVQWYTFPTCQWFFFLPDFSL